jgi:hypothetical protein
LIVLAAVASGDISILPGSADSRGYVGTSLEVLAHAKVETFAQIFDKKFGYQFHETAFQKKPSLLKMK